MPFGLDYAEARKCIPWSLGKHLRKMTRFSEWAKRIEGLVTTISARRANDVAQEMSVERRVGYSLDVSSTHPSPALCYHFRWLIRPAF